MRTCVCVRVYVRACIKMCVAMCMRVSAPSFLHTYRARRAHYKVRRVQLQGVGDALRELPYNFPHSEGLVFWQQGAEYVCDLVRQLTRGHNHNA